MSVVERLALVQAALVLQQDRRGHLTDSDILDAVEDWAEGPVHTSVCFRRVL